MEDMMTNEETQANPEVEQENTPQEVENTQEESKPIQEKESQADRNFREVRRKAEQAERERDELKRYIEELRQERQQKAEPQEEEPQLAPDDLVEWRVVDKKIKSLEQKLEQQQKASYQTTVESKVRTKYNDFDAVVNQDNISSLREAYPELAASLASSTDLYSQSVAVYTAIKKLGIYAPDTYGPDKQKAQDNASKPRPLASVGAQQGDSPLSQANAFSQGLTPELKKKIWAEMQENIKRG